MVKPINSPSPLPAPTPNIKKNGQNKRNDLWNSIPCYFIIGMTNLLDIVKLNANDAIKQVRLMIVFLSNIHSLLRSSTKSYNIYHSINDLALSNYPVLKFKG